MLGTLKGLLGDNAEEKIGMVMNALQKDNETPINVEDDIIVNNNDSSQYISQIKNIIGQMSHANDSRSNLLMSLRPFMRKNRQKSIDNVIKILNLSKYSGLFK
jgi:hypothetical protein